MLLTILIPSRNRKDRLRPLVAHLLANLPASRRTDIEVLVLDNCSEEPAADFLAPYACDMLRIVTNEQLQPTSEENVVNGLKHANGDYIWFLGDDDLPRFNAVGEMIELVAAGETDLFISNFKVVDGEGRLASLSQIRGALDDAEAPLVSIVKRIGMINVLSGWSIIVARRSMLDEAVAREIMKTGVIYAHCFWFLECFADKQVRFLAKPLVDYRVFHHAGGWSRYTEEQNVGYLHYWHLGLIRHYARTMRNGTLSARDIAETFEYRHNGTRYRAIDEIVYKLIEQADIYIHSGLDRNLLTQAEFDEASEWLLNVDLALQDVLFAVRDYYAMLWRGLNDLFDVETAQSNRARAIALLSSRDGDLFSPFFSSFAYSYSIYRYGENWIAIRDDAMGFIDSVFAQFEPRAMPPGILVAKSEDKLRTAIHRTPPRQEPVGQRPPPVSMALLDEFQTGPRNPLLGKLGDDLLKRADRDAGESGHPGTAPVRHLWLGTAAYRRADQRVQMQDGWSHPEADGIWSLGSRSIIDVQIPNGALRLCMDVHAFAPRNPRAFRFLIAGTQQRRMVDGARTTVCLPVPQAIADLDVEIICEEIGTPLMHEVSSDTRSLGLFVHRIWSEESRPAGVRKRPFYQRWYGWLRRRL